MFLCALTSLTFSNTIVEATSYDQYRLQPYSITAGQTGQTPLLSLSYSYCPGVAAGTANAGCTSNNGNLWSQKIAPSSTVALTQYYSYDNMNRLSVATENPTTAPAPPANVGCPDAGSSWCESYDDGGQFGNRKVSARSNLTASLLEPAAFNQQTNRMANGTNGTSWTYDNAGNLTSYANGVLTGGYAFDAENRNDLVLPICDNMLPKLGVWQYKLHL